MESFFSGFLLTKTVYQVLKVPSLVIFRSCGTDESFLNIGEKELRIIGTVRLFFEKSYLVKGWVPTPSLFNFLWLLKGLLFAIFFIIRLFPEMKKSTLFQKIGFLMFRAWVKAFFESYGYPLIGVLWCCKFNINFHNTVFLHIQKNFAFLKLERGPFPACHCTTVGSVT